MTLFILIWLLCGIVAWFIEIRFRGEMTLIDLVMVVFCAVAAPVAVLLLVITRSETVLWRRKK